MHKQNSHWHKGKKCRALPFIQFWICESIKKTTNNKNKFSCFYYDTHSFVGFFLEKLCAENDSPDRCCFFIFIFGCCGHHCYDCCFWHRSRLCCCCLFIVYHYSWFQFCQKNMLKFVICRTNTSDAVISAIMSVYAGVSLRVLRNELHSFSVDFPFFNGLCTSFLEIIPGRRWIG